jgi:hypothetical protein
MLVYNWWWKWKNEALYTCSKNCCEIDACYRIFSWLSILLLRRNLLSVLVWNRTFSFVYLYWDLLKNSVCKLKIEWVRKCEQAFKNTFQNKSQTPFLLLLITLEGIGPGLSFGLFLEKKNHIKHEIREKYSFLIFFPFLFI